MLEIKSLLLKTPSVDQFDRGCQCDNIKMETRLIVFMTIFFVSGSDTKKLNETDNILKLIKDAGYMGEAHRVVTEDGYILKVHRVLPKRESTSKPVFLMHGILATAADFLITGPNIALAYLLADNGYDVCFVHRTQCLHLKPALRPLF